MTRSPRNRLTEPEFNVLGPHRWLAIALESQRGALESALRRLESDERDTEAIHDVRVTSRRLRGILDAGREFIAGKPARRLARRLKTIRRELGGPREAEVGAALLANLKERLSPAARGAAGSMAAQLLSRRDDFDRTGGELVDRLALNRLRRRLVRVIRDLEDHRWPRDHAAPMTLADFCQQALEALREAWEAVRALPLEPLELHDAEAQHRFRIAGKKLRYALELFAPLFPPPIVRRIALLKGMQDQLGHLHDLADLSLLAATLAMKAVEAGFSEEAAGFRDLAEKLDAERRHGFKGFRGRHRALTHPGFLPPGAIPAVPVIGGSDAPDPGPTHPVIPTPSESTDAPALDAPPDETPSRAERPPPFRIIGGGQKDST
ncbi:MAG: CHAD domain-containing protein [Candidatus Eisenbacteria bacterium]|nr:CHAD domain-containing protein [Candidatus Eisenbacteria bacterium]